MRRWLTVLSPVATRVGVLAIAAPTLAVAVVLGLSARAGAADHPVNSESDLRTAITSAVDGDTITFHVDVTLTQDLPAIQTDVTILGNNKILDGASAFRGFFVAKFSGIVGTPAAATVTIQDLTIRNARARGGSGTDGGGGGAGLGGALFVANLATVTVSNLQLDTNSALGGLGGVDGNFGGGGGGGLGGSGGGQNAGGGGGVGADADGGASGGGGGGDGSAGIILGLASGGDGGGGQFGLGGRNGGGGGGGGDAGDGGAGGGGVAGFPGSNGGSGGNGGFGGGGGGAGNESNGGSSGGNGGFGGGGGASGLSSSTEASTSTGGFGGGGGARASGGFGGGGGAISPGFPGGGGGAGLGGALFVQEGGSLTVAGPLTINGSTVTGGAVLDRDATGGSAFGSGIFLQGDGGPLTFTPGAGETQTIADDIADQTGSGGAGVDAGSWELTKSGAGTLALSGVNTYSGDTTVSGGTLAVDGSITSPVTVTSGGTLGGAGTIGNTVTVNSGGTLSPGSSSTAILNTGDVSLTAGSTLTVEINGTAVGTQYDQVNVTGGVTLGSATLNVVVGFTPSAGQTFTIIARDLSDGVGGTFSGLPEAGIFTAGVGRFRISYVGGSGNDVTLTALNVPPTIAKSFGVANLALNGTTTLSFMLANPDPGAALTGVGFSDALSAGLTVADGTTATCGGTLTTSGGDTIALAGATIAPGGTCVFSLTVTGTAAGAKSNTTGAVSSSEGGMGGTASASLTVVAPPTIATAFGASSIVVNGTTTQSFTLTNPNAGTALTGVGFTDTLPAGLVVATPNGLASTCGGTVTADTGTGSVGLVNGGLPAAGSCAITLNVTGATAGAKETTTSAVTSTEGGTGGTASAGLAVVGPPTIAKAFGAASLGLNETTTLTFTIANPAGNGAALTAVGFTDALPAGLVVATPNGLEGSCGGGTITATAGASTTGLAGATLAAGTSCVFAIDVRAVAPGPQANTTSAVTSANGGSGNAATASITVSAVPIPTLSAFAQAVFVMVVLLSSLLLRRRPTPGR